jgi:hypothetical protein
MKFKLKCMKSKLWNNHSCEEMNGECCGVPHPCSDPVIDSPRYWGIHVISHFFFLPFRWRRTRVESEWDVIWGPSTCRTRARPQRELICPLKMLKIGQDKVSRVILVLDKNFCYFTLLYQDTFVHFWVLFGVADEFTSASNSPKMRRWYVIRDRSWLFKMRVLCKAATTIK